MAKPFEQMLYDICFPTNYLLFFKNKVTVTSNVVSVRVRKFIKLRQYVQSQRMLAFRYTIDYQVHLICTSKKSCIALSAGLRSSHQTWSLSYLWLMENLYNTFWSYFMFFSHKSIFPGRTLREHLGLAATIANSNILFQMRIFKFVSVLAYFATTMVCVFPFFILIFFRCNFHAKSVMHAFVWTDITIITIILTKSLLYHDIISSS